MVLKIITLIIFYILYLGIGHSWAGYYGPGLFFNDNNSNLPVGKYTGGAGGTNYKTLISFKAEKSLNMTKFRTYFQAGAGYAAGTCGTMLVRVYPSNGGNPPAPVRTGTPLSSGSITFTCSSGDMPFASKWSLITLTPANPLVAGTLYFIEISNTDAAPQTNWVSVNARCALLTHVTADPHIAAETDWSLYWEGSSINNVSINTDPGLYTGLYHFPNAEIGYSDGSYQGHIRLEPGNYSGYQYSVTSSAPVRERINISSTMQITGVEIHAAASTAGNLSVAFVKNDVTQVTKTISQSPADYYTTDPNDNGVYSWRVIDLAAGEYFTVTSGDVLDIKMTSVSTAVWKMSADRTGLDTGLGWSATAMETYASAQAWTGSTWYNTIYMNKTGANQEFGTSHFRVILKTSSSTPSAPVLTGASCVGCKIQ